MRFTGIENPIFTRTLSGKVIHRFCGIHKGIFCKDIRNSNQLHFSFDFSHLEKIGLNEEIPLRSWFLRGFAGVLRGSALVDKLWDKLVCGAVKLLPFIAVALVEVKKVLLQLAHEESKVKAIFAK